MEKITERYPYLKILIKSIARSEVQKLICTEKSLLYEEVFREQWQN